MLMGVQPTSTAAQCIQCFRPICRVNIPRTEPGRLTRLVSARAWLLFRPDIPWATQKSHFFSPPQKTASRATLC